MVNSWKVTAIIFIVLFNVLLILNIWSVTYAFSEVDAFNDCLYNICEEYPDAYYEYDVCTCYDINEYGEYEVAKTRYTK